MSSSTDAKWSWPTDLPKPAENTDDTTPRPIPGAFHEEPEIIDHPGLRQRKAEQNPPKNPKSGRSWPPRTCRICFETVLPTFHPVSTALPGVLQPAASVTYQSEDPELGRLIRPCKCKGGSRYVHEGCLQAWRYADPDFGKRNYWQCPTCGFQYRLQRMTWGRLISGTTAQLVLTVLICLFATFILGFFADPIINLYLDPYSTVFSGSLSKLSEPVLEDDGSSWTVHFIKGLASLGLLGFVKVLFALSPWQWWNLRSSGIMTTGGRAGANGRDRMANLSWIVVVIGLGTFLYAVWRGVRVWSRRTLEKASERVMDVPLADDEDEFDE